MVVGKQNFKSIYFADHPGGDAKRRSLKLAFGPDDADLFGLISPLASEDLRNLLRCGSFGDLKALAVAEGTSLNAYCLRRLRQSTARADSAQLPLFPGEHPEPLPFNPVQATYRGGKAEPLHGWYPYLEGYSPDFVQNVLDTFAPTAVRVLDPFAGTGTTPLTAALAGRICFYCELNPVLQFVIQTKARILSLPHLDRLRLAARVQDLSINVASSLAKRKPDHRLGAAYEKCFGGSRFFSADTLQTCLKLRSWIDSISCEDADAASLVTIASVAALLPCSNMIRRGDLRFRKGSERADIIQDLPGEVGARLRSIVEDIRGARSIVARPTFIASDAKRLGHMPGLDIDAIVTSPPYLNGTNYYRNTKIELWFLRALSSVDDLTAFRRQTVTAGINDVTTEKTKPPVSAAVERVVESLEEKAYDRRIPMMVSSYFAEVMEVLGGLSVHVQPMARLLMDIGDSSYAGVRVDTPTILADLLKARGWTVDGEVTLRQRLSRNGQPLRQVLLVATAPSHSAKRHHPPLPRQTKWETFKDALPHQHGDFAKRNWGSPLHSLCSYQGKLKPSLAHYLVKTFTSPGDRLLDPFGGVGTIGFEAALHGVTTWSFDISPVAVQVAAAKLRRATSRQCVAVLNELDDFVHAHRPTDEERNEASLIRFNGSLQDYYHPRTLGEILLARRFFKENPPADGAASLVLACLLHILHGNRPYALSRHSHPITPFSPRGPSEYREMTGRLTKKLQRSLSAKLPDDFVEGSSVFHDATERWPRNIDQLDAVITSPPFYDSTRFHLANWIRLWFAGWSSEDFKERPPLFVDERQKKSFEVYRPVLRNARERLKPGGICVFHLGKSRKCDMANEIARVARPWFQNTEVFAENVTHCESHGIRDKGTVVEHTYLLMW